MPMSRNESLNESTLVSMESATQASWCYQQTRMPMSRNESLNESTLVSTLSSQEIWAYLEKHLRQAPINSSMTRLCSSPQGMSRSTLIRLRCAVA